MALQKTFTTIHGFTSPSAYHKIDRIHGDKTTIHFCVSTYYDATARNADNEPLECRSYTLATPTTDLFTALYTHLKNLPEFSDALDV